ncbi:hypothetical protein COCVIDRAFT_116334 [Bipolaris victoriae FI3]|uniref:WSC domain-containing protein n=1 Tax=Bipolaris victoriae (strain FI3) TaxID=930091 RepID=W7DQR3_BIPV3|nr:hypothetical protein COCVIDRAFT_116334 [Bipolaris victoriae FI3]
MKFTAAIPVLALFATGVAADNCREGLYYCGKTLTNMGNYESQIQIELIRTGWGSGYRADSGNFLFWCRGGENGQIQSLGHCTSACNDNGRGRSDNCRGGVIMNNPRFPRLRR